jgi:DnaJ-class molecular chaperone
MATYAKAAKCYSMKPCPSCKGEGRGRFQYSDGSYGSGWMCDNCDATGKVSIYPPAKNIWAGYSTMYERQAGA